MQWNDFFQQGALSDDLVREKPIIGVYGMFQIGKSTLINCLLEDYVALTGRGKATTALSARFRHGDCFDLKYRTLKGNLQPTSIAEINTPDFMDRVKMDSGFHIEARLPSALLEKCDIVDTPGFNASDRDNSTAMIALEEVHYVIFVIPNRGLQMYEKSLLLDFFHRKIPVLLVMNCVEGRAMGRWIPGSRQNQTILQSIEAWIASTGFQTEMINGRMVHPCNFLLYWFFQSAYAKSVSYIDRPENIERHIRWAMEDEDILFSAQNALRASGVNELICFLEQRIENYNPITHEWRA